MGKSSSATTSSFLLWSLLWVAYCKIWYLNHLAISARINGGNRSIWLFLSKTPRKEHPLRRPLPKSPYQSLIQWLIATPPVEKTTHCPNQPLQVKACQNENILVTARTTHSRWGGHAAPTRMCIDLHAGYSFSCLLWNHNVYLVVEQISGPLNRFS